MSNISYILSPFSAETVENKRPEKRRRIDSHFAPTLDSQPIQASGHGAAQLVVDRNDGTCELASHEVESAERICFGMIIALPVDLIDQTVSTGVFESQVDSAGHLHFNNRSTAIGRLHSQIAAWLGPLCSHPKIEHQATTRVAAKTAPAKNSSSCLVEANLSVIIYGPAKLVDDVGQLVGRNGQYLQDPIGCDRVVEYRNPHRLSSLDPVTIFTSIGENLNSGLTDYVSNPMDLLRGFESAVELPEYSTPPALRTRLLKHQRQALAFMAQRERGWMLHEPGRDLWTAESINGEPVQYLNNVSERRQCEPPPPFYGGILSDHMGLGKSLSMIALMALDKNESSMGNTGIGSPALGGSTNTSLVVMPSSLLHSWEKQFESHLEPGSILWRRHHGKTKLEASSWIDNYHIIITSFETVASEWSRRKRNNFLFSIYWKRIILDEAHHIRNTATTTAQAVFSLRGGARWAITGTPIQNKLADLASLLRFIGAYPYSDLSKFEVDIARKWKQGAEDVAISRLKQLLGYIMLRRSANAIELPPRHDLVHKLDFNTQERAVYDAAKAEFVRSLDEQLFSGVPEKGAYMNALQRINRLRRICNLGVRFGAVNGQQLSINAERSESKTWGSSTANDIFHNMATVGVAICSKCFEEIAELEEENTLATEEPQSEPWLSECLVVVCNKCFQTSTHMRKGAICEHEPSCPIIQLSRSVQSAAADRSTLDVNKSIEWPTKIKALQADLQNGEEKSIVFSYWTSTLDAIQDALELTNIKCVRLDGKISQSNRISALNIFESDPSVRVLLASISCGAVGLTLTAASRAYLFEPHWNPSMEEQALARIYRMGQTKEVTTIRYIMRQSYEEHVVRVQDRKKHLVDLLLSKGQASKKDLTLSRLHHLRSLLD